MNKNHIDSYLRSLKRELRLRGLSHNEILAEVESHLLDARDRGNSERTGPAGSPAASPGKVWLRPVGGRSI